MPAFQRFDALGKRLERQIRIGTNHARERNLERQARIRRRFQFGRQVAQHAEQTRQTIRPEQRQFAHQFAPLGIAHFQDNVGIGQRHDVQIADVLGQIARELSQIGSRFHELRRPAKARGHIALANGLHDLGQIVRIHPAQHALGHLKRNLALAERDKLLKRGQRVAHAAFSAMGDQVKRLALELHVLGHADGAQPRHDGLSRNAAEIETLAARVDGFGNLLGIGSSQHEYHVARRLFKRLEQRVERRRRQHVNLVDDVDLVPTARRSELNATDDLLAHILHARATCGVQFVHVGMLAVGNHRAIIARSVRLGRRAVLAQKRLGKQARRSGFAGAARAGEQVRVTYLILLDRVFDSAFDMLLANDVFEYLRPVFSVQCLCHSARLPLSRMHPWLCERGRPALACARVFCVLAHYRRSALSAQPPQRATTASAGAASQCYDRVISQPSPWRSSVSP